MIEKKFIYLFLTLVPLVLFVYLYKNGKDEEAFASDDSIQSVDSMQSMFDALQDAEKRCAEIEEREMLDNQRAELLHNQATLNQLEELDKKILELKDIVRVLTIEKKRRDSITNKCRASKQQVINSGYDFVNKLEKDGGVPEGLKLDLGLKDFMDKHGIDIGKLPSNGKCEKKDPNLYHEIKIGKDGLVLEDGSTCHNCDLKNSDSLQNKLMKSFKI